MCPKISAFRPKYVTATRGGGRNKEFVCLFLINLGACSGGEMVKPAGLKKEKVARSCAVTAPQPLMTNCSQERSDKHPGKAV